VGVGAPLVSPIHRSCNFEYRSRWDVPEISTLHQETNPSWFSAGKKWKVIIQNSICLGLARGRSSTNFELLASAEAGPLKVGKESAASRRIDFLSVVRSASLFLLTWISISFIIG
jgi:hypothetical protein